MEKYVMYSLLEGHRYYTCDLLIGTIKKVLNISSLILAQNER
jgi:hypothetical protein